MTRVAMIALALACASSAPEEPGPTGPPLMSSRDCPPGQKVGDFRIDLAASFTAVSGSVAAGVVPVDVPELVAESGGCQLLRRRRLVCATPCGAGLTCGEDGRCLPYPANLDAGTVRVGGLLRPVTMRPEPTTRRYFATGLPHPGFTPGADIHLAASGAQLPPFALAGWGVPALALVDGPLALAPDQPFVLAWQPGPPGPARIELTLNIDQHALTPASLVCHGADSGRLEVPAALISQLLAAGASGYPQARLSRQSADAIALPPGCVELLVDSGVSKAVSVAGHTPCHADGDCPAGRCDTAAQTCR
jgi:hypothetical protein